MRRPICATATVAGPLLWFFARAASLFLPWLFFRLGGETRWDGSRKWKKNHNSSRSPRRYVPERTLLRSKRRRGRNDWRRARGWLRSRRDSHLRRRCGRRHRACWLRGQWGWRRIFILQARVGRSPSASRSQGRENVYLVVRLSEIDYLALFWLCSLFWLFSLFCDCRSFCGHKSLSISGNSLSRSLSLP